MSIFELNINRIWKYMKYEYGVKSDIIYILFRCFHSLSDK